MFYTKYKKLCEAKGLSTSGGALAAGFSKSTVSSWRKKYQNGEDVRPERDILAKIAEYFNCTESWLLDIEETPSDSGERSGLNDLTDEQLTELFVKLISGKSKDSILRIAAKLLEIASQE